MAAAKLPAKRWATIAPNYEYGQSAVAVFKKLMSEKRPDIQWVDEQWPPQGKIDAGPVVQAVAAANPEAILNVTFGADLVKLVREGNTRGLFKDHAVVSFLTGEPEYLDPLKEETPEGWIVTGYPWYSIKTPDHDAFLKAYKNIGSFRFECSFYTWIYRIVTNLALDVVKHRNRFRHEELRDAEILRAGIVVARHMNVDQARIDLP